MDQYSTYIIIILLVIWLTARERTFRPSSMWIVPLLWGGMALSSIPWASVGPVEVVLFAVFAAAGLATGIIRGKMEKMRMGMDGQVTVQGSIASILLFLAVLALRVLAQSWGQSHAFYHIANALMFMPLGSICARRYVIYRRYQAMMGQRA
ncbi:MULTISPECIES: CcdC protein domain-containing protein [Paenibacillus]|uniref:CcdC protein domain-containing protein n=1 Tax=Paenibacillus TaxID=44249 RepID=UPI000E3B526F|nr:MULTISPECIES: CcdC protein domain-containing protein [Paenibacillus]RED36771.1 uncharacterized protein DUF1453 [Paenibacillus sp. VMFN-D1]GIO63880.1 hypothetical protein J43TS9_54540 [Paenibacillus cineris]